MITRNTVKRIASLQQQKFRKELGLFVVEGRKTVSELLQSRLEVDSLFATQAFLDGSDVPFPQAEIVTEVQMQQMSGLDTPPGLLAVAKIPKNGQISASTQLILALDGIANPGNMGTLLRTAEWFGLHDVVCSTDCVEIWNPKVIQAAMGSAFRINIIATDLPGFLTEQKQLGKAIYGALLEGENLFEIKEKVEGILVIGSESHGIRKEVLPYITRPLTIPRKDGSPTESLNAAVAAGILMAELTR
jgi:TrmH family RNA methyltransferase